MPDPRQRCSHSNCTLPSIITWTVTAISFTSIDLVWLGIVGKPIYTKLLGPLLAPEVYTPAAIIFYLFFITTIFGYAVLGAQTAQGALKRGSFLGMVAYTTYELTNWAIITAWPSMLVPIDIAWGIFLTSTTSWIGYKVHVFQISKKNAQ